MPKEFYSNGKLLLSGEYIILDGGQGLAVPTKFGQHLLVQSTKTGLLEWNSLDIENTSWFTATYRLSDFKEIKTSNTAISNTLSKILLGTRELNKHFLSNSTGCTVTTELTFPRNWGLGSSSTLINNIAQWANIDAHQLLWKTMGGSGYDISCAQHDHPILYLLENGHPIVEKVEFNPSFKQKLFFVHLNRKQDSKAAIATYREQDFDKNHVISELSKITNQMLQANNLHAFEAAIEFHEEILSRALKLERVQNRLFPDYFGKIKSLGGWGGDFVLATGNDKTPEYFKSKGFGTVISFPEMVLQHP